MKKVRLLFLLITSIASLAGCSSNEFEEVVIDGFELYVEVERVINQGANELEEEELAELLPDLVIEVEPLDLRFNLELVSAEFKHDLGEGELAELAFMVPQTDEIIIDTKGQVLFGEITFNHAGSFTYKVTQNAVEVDEEDSGLGWVLDHTDIYIIVTVTEDEEYRVLRVSIEFLNDSRLTNQFIIEIEEEVNAALIDRLHQMQDELEVLLQEVVDEVVGPVGISYYCLTTGRHIAINGDFRFNSASTRKLPTHMIIAESIRDGRMSWDQHLTFVPEHFAEGSGNLQYTIQHGDTFTVEELIEYSIVYSDNIAHKILLNTISFSERERFVYSIFGQDLPGEPIVGGWFITPNQLTEIIRVLYRDKDEIEEYKIILEYMMNTSWSDRFATELADGYVAHTPGWSFGYSHDSGIFFTDYPYILVIMTLDVPTAMTWDPDALYPNFISEVSDMVFELHYELQ